MLRPYYLGPIPPLLPRCRRGAEPAREPRRHFLIEEPAVLALQNPVVFLRPDDEPGGNLLALERGPEFERVVHRHAKIALTHRHEHGRVQVRGAAHRALCPPDRMVLPRRPADVALAIVVEVARGPLAFEVPLARMAHQGAITRGRHRRSEERRVGKECGPPVALG